MQEVLRTFLNGFRLPRHNGARSFPTYTVSPPRYESVARVPARLRDRQEAREWRSRTIVCRWAQKECPIRDRREFPRGRLLWKRPQARRTTPPPATRDRKVPQANIECSRMIARADRLLVGAYDRKRIAHGRRLRSGSPSVGERTAQHHSD